MTSGASVHLGHFYYYPKTRIYHFDWYPSIFSDDDLDEVYKFSFGPDRIRAIDVRSYLNYRQTTALEFFPQTYSEIYIPQEKN